MARGRVGVVCLGIISFFLSAVSVRAATATLSGQVLDPAGARLPGATVTATNVATNVAYGGATNREGLYVIVGLPTGTYRVTVELTGFKTIVKPDVEMHVQDTLTLNFSMELGSVIQSVTVEGGAPLVNTRSASVGTLIDRQFVENLPLNGRSFQTLIGLSPGVVFTPASISEQGQFSVNGQRPNTNRFSVDGVSANVYPGVASGAEIGQQLSGGLPGLTVSGSTSGLVTVDALQEFKVQTSTYSAEFGRGPGAQISMITRSGTNELRGSFFEFFRNDALDANDWFAKRQGLPKAALRQNAFGGVLGGPLTLPGYRGRDRTFFFFSYEGLRLRQPISAITDVPTREARLTAVPAAQPLLNAFPLPTGPSSGGNLAPFAASYSNPSSSDAYSIRLDHSVNPAVRVFGRYNYSPSSLTTRGNGGTLASIREATVDMHTLTFGSTQSGGRVSNDLRINYSDGNGTLEDSLDTFGGAAVPPESFLFPNPALKRGRSVQFILEGVGMGLSAGFVGDNRQRQWNLVNTFNMQVGRHQLKLGVDYLRLLPSLGVVSAVSLQSLFDNVARASLGLASEAFISAQPPSIQPVFDNLAIFSHDTWTLTQRLTLDYGIRLDHTPPPSADNDLTPPALNSTENLAALDLAAPGTPLYKHTTLVQPRIGVAYRIWGNGPLEGALRGGWGIFGQASTSTAALGYRFDPYRASFTIFNAVLPLSEAATTPPEPRRTPPYPQVQSTDPALDQPYVHQWNVALEQALGTHQTVTISYVGAAGRRLFRVERFTNPNPRFVTVLLTRNAATSDYKGLQVQFERRLADGLQAMASYTWATSRDNISNETSSANAPVHLLDPEIDRGFSDFDIRHSLSSAVSWRIPGGRNGNRVSGLLRDWWLDVLFTGRSAPPVTVTYSRNIGFGSASIRPDPVAGVDAYLDDASAPGGRRLNRAAFVIPTEVRQGQVPRNSVRGFPFYQTDLAVRRHIRVGSFSVRLAAEIFNVINRANFALPIGVLTSSQFGLSPSMLNRGLGSGGSAGGLNPLYQIGGPRSVQLSLKFGF